MLINTEDGLYLQHADESFINLDFQAVSLVTKNYHAIFQGYDGEYYGFGGELHEWIYGLVDRTSEIYKIELGHKILSVACGKHHVAFNTEDGWYLYGGHKRYKEYFLSVRHFNIEILSVSCGMCCTYFVTVDGLYVLGENYYSQLGIEGVDSAPVPTKLDFDYHVIRVYCLEYVVVVLTDDGLYGCGGIYGTELGFNGHVYKTLTKMSLDKKIISVNNKNNIVVYHTEEGVYVSGRYFVRNNYYDEIMTKLEYNIHSVESCGYGSLVLETDDGLYTLEGTTLIKLELNKRLKRPSGRAKSARKI